MRHGPPIDGWESKRSQNATEFYQSDYRGNPADTNGF